MQEKMKKFFILLGIFVIYLVAAKLGLTLASIHPSATAVWPATGIAFSAFLLCGFRIWPIIFIGAFLVNITTYGSLITSIGIALGNTLEGVIGAYLVKRFAKGLQVFNCAQDIIKFGILAGMLSTTVSATLGVTSLSLGGFAPWGEYKSIWLTWWLGDLAGNLIIAPLLILWWLQPHVSWNLKQIIEALFMYAFLLVVGQIVFSGILPIEFLCLPPLIWAAIRFSQREVATALFLLATLAIWNTLQGFGPYADKSQNISLLFLQAFMSIAAITTLVLAAVTDERRKAESALQNAYGDLEQRVQQRTEELSRSNRDLEQFAYVTSHDLQEPLREIKNFTQLLAKHYTEKLDKEAEEYIGFIEGGVTRMHQNISDLLTYSRIGRAGLEEVVDIEKIVKMAINNLQSLIKSTDTTISYDHLPIVKAKPAVCLQLLQNLLSNAIKFRREVPPQIYISCSKNNGEWLFAVKDNGMGIADEYFEQIFVIFKRLHTHDEYPGSGIGLAICKKIVEQHGGRIWVESEPDKGSTFYFTLPC